MDAQDPGHAGEYKITFDTSHTGPGESKNSWIRKNLHVMKSQKTQPNKTKASKYSFIQEIFINCMFYVFITFND